MKDLPLRKYPIDYECTHIYDISDTLEKHGLDITNLKRGKPTKNKYHDYNFHDFISKKIQTENTIYPKIRLIDEPGNDDERLSNYTDPGSVVLLPSHYDSSNDEEVYKKNKDEGRNRLIDSFKKLYKGDQLKKMITYIDTDVDFGQNNFEYANIALDIIYEEYKQYFKNGYLRVWMPFDWDSSTEFDSGENTAHGYPMNKMPFLSDIEEYLDSNYNLRDELFYQYVVNNCYVENRYWEKPLGLYLNKDLKFIREGGEYGMDATPTIDKMLSILEMEYKFIILENDDEYFPIYIDYYKKIKSKY